MGTDLCQPSKLPDIDVVSNAPKSDTWIFPRLAWIFSQRKNLFRATIPGAIAGAILAFSLPSHFESRTRLTLARESADSVDDYNIPQLSSPLALLVRVMQSRTVGDRIVDRFDLRTAYRTPLRAAARARLAMNTKFSFDGELGMINITVIDEDAKRAADICNSYAEEVNYRMSEIAASSFHRERVFLEAQRDLVQPGLHTAATKLGEFSSENPGIDVDEQGEDMLSSQAHLQGMIASVGAELQGLKETHTYASPQARVVAAEVETFKSELRRLEGRPSERSPNSKARFISFGPSLGTLPVIKLPYDDLSRQTTTEANQYVGLSRLIELAKTQEEKWAPSLTVIDAAMVPEKSLSHHYFLIVMAGSFLFFGLSVRVISSRFQNGQNRDALGVFP